MLGSGKVLAVYAAKVSVIATSERAEARAGTVERVFQPVRSMAVGFRLNPPLRFCEGSAS